MGQITTMVANYANDYCFFAMLTMLLKYQDQNEPNE
jgi:hypothetical protein